MIIHKNFTGGNIHVISTEKNVVSLTNELRDTLPGTSWFYWAFCVEGAQGQTITFRFDRDLLGYYGPAVSHDLRNWHWLNSVNEDFSFTYTFAEDEKQVYFAHHMLYHPDRFFEFAEKHHLKLETLCNSRHGLPVPCFHYGSGSRIIYLTAREHACESPGSAVLEGVLEGLFCKGIPDSQIFCIPFVDYDGVIFGDQGKNRYPIDHNQDYDPTIPAYYPETEALRRIAETNGVYFGADFHAPYQKGDIERTIFIVRSCTEKLPQLDRFGRLLEEHLNENAIQYNRANDFPPNTAWNQPDIECINTMMHWRAGADLSFGIENTYFGTPDNIYTHERAVEFGRCFAAALYEYMTTQP